MKFDKKFSFVERVTEDSAKYQVLIYMQINEKDPPVLVGIAYTYNNTWRICNNPVYETYLLKDAVKESIDTYLRYHQEFEKLKLMF
jgi:hypothetical protein